MYTVRIVHHPAADQVPELRAALAEHSKACNAAGSPHNVTQLLYGDEFTFVNAIRYESLADIEAYPAKYASDPKHQARTARISGAVARPQGSALYETLLTTDVAGDVNYVLRRNFYPAPGKAAELRQALVARAKTASPGSVGKAVNSLVLGSDRPHFVLATFFSGLDGFGQYLNAQPSSQGVQSFVAQVGALIADSSQEMHRVLVRFTDT